jgi:hypothetical protein
MTAVVKVKANTVAIGTATNVYKASYAYVVNTNSAEQTITVANTVGPQNGGGDAGTIVLEAGASIIIRKQPTDTLASSSDVKATNVSRG